MLSRKADFSKPVYWFAAFFLLITLFFLINRAGITNAAEKVTYGVRLSPESWAEASNITPIQTIDYGAFVWLELDQEAFVQLQAEKVSYEQLEEGYTLRLGELSFDPVQNSPDLPAGWDSVSNSPDYHLVQFSGPTKSEWLGALERNDLHVVQYVHPFTYVVWGENFADKITADPTLATVVRWSGSFAPAYRVLPQWRNMGNQAVDFDVLIYRGADADRVIQAISGLGAAFRGSGILNDTWEIAGFSMPGSLFQTAAQIPGVYSIQPVPADGGLRGEMSNQINVGNYNGNNQAFPGYQAWLTAAGVDGSGVTIADVDGGVQEDHPDLVNRMVSCTGTTCSGTNDPHGTHTAGIMVADGASGTVDSFGFLRGLGMAPGANLFEQVYAPWYTQPDGMLLLMTDSYNNGASLSGNSWGPSGSPHGYDDDTLQVDIGVRDADPNAAGNQPLTYVLSFMNGFGGTSSQGTPDEAKNLFNIGSTKMQTSGGTQILDIDDLSSNTAHGPALDGRTIPHMVAPGCYVDSTITNDNYDQYCGTSMASPHVSGAVALFIEYYRNLMAASGFGSTDPSPALVKAAFLPVAHDLAGNQDADGGTLGHPFDSKQGWGRMDTAAVVSPTVSVLYFDNPAVFDNTAEEWTQTVNPADPSQPIRMMLVWTDAPGHGLGGSTPAWNNDLDLVVEAEGNTYLGNHFNGSGWSQAGGTADNKNNTEGIFLGPMPTMMATIRVVAANITSDGIPKTGDTTDQDFALVCYNCALDYDVFLPAIVGDGSPGASQTNVTPLLLPFFGIVAVGLTKRKRKGAR
ncbi:MAG: S8 family serine peptidase [Candidatus Promineifilaceae bacterium]